MSRLAGLHICAFTSVVEILSLLVIIRSEFLYIYGERMKDREGELIVMETESERTNMTGKAGIQARKPDGSLHSFSYVTLIQSPNFNEFNCIILK